MKDFNALFQFVKNPQTIKDEKARLRSQIKHLKQELDIEKKQKASELVFNKIEELDLFKNSKTVMIYWATSGELPTQSFIKKWVDSKIIILPCIKKDKIILKSYSTDVNMVQRALGIWEPDLKEVFDGTIDLTIVPGVAFDKNKNRLGRGGGYYDKLFKRSKTIKIGVGFDCQFVHKIPVNIWDKQLDMIITPSYTIK